MGIFVNKLIHCECTTADMNEEESTIQLLIEKIRTSQPITAEEINMLSSQLQQEEETSNSLNVEEEEEFDEENEDCIIEANKRKLVTLRNEKSKKQKKGSASPTRASENSDRMDDDNLEI